MASRDVFQAVFFTGRMYPLLGSRFGLAEDLNIGGIGANRLRGCRLSSSSHVLRLTLLYFVLLQLRETPIFLWCGVYIVPASVFLFSKTLGPVSAVPPDFCRGLKMIMAPAVFPAVLGGSMGWPGAGS